MWKITAKCDFISYLSAIGGLMGMWLGFSVYSCSVWFVNFLKIITNIKLTIVKRKYRISKTKPWKHIKLIKNLLLVICFYFMCNQSLQIYKDYIEFNIKMKVDFVTKVQIPGLKFSMIPDIVNINIIERHIKNMSLLKIHNDFTYKITRQLNWYRLNYVYIANRLLFSLNNLSL